MVRWAILVSPPSGEDRGGRMQHDPGEKWLLAIYKLQFTTYPNTKYPIQPYLNAQSPRTYLHGNCALRDPEARRQMEC